MSTRTLALAEETGRHGRASLSRLVRTVCLVFLSVLLVLLGVAAWWTYSSAFAEAERAAADMTHTAESQLLRILEQGDLLLFEERDIALSTDWDDPASSRLVKERLAQRTHILPYVFGLSIFGPDGSTLASSRAATGNLKVDDREYFSAQREF